MPELEDGQLEDGQGVVDEQKVIDAEVIEKPAPKKPSNEIKVVIVMKDENVLLGVQSPDCDPVYTTVKGSLSVALKKVPALVAEAKQKWEANPRYPKADLPEPPPISTPARSQPAQPSEKKKQPSFF